MTSLNNQQPVLATIQSYEIDLMTGFVPSHEPVGSLTGAFEAYDQVAPKLSARIRSGTIRRTLKELPLLEVRELSSVPERERALLLLTVFANAWVWGGVEPDLAIPKNVAIPLCELAQAMGRPPLVHYASMALNNWVLLDRSRPLSTDNATMRVQLLGEVDEDWFFIASVGVELAGAPLLPLIHAGVELSHAGDTETLTTIVEQIADGMDGVLAALARMREWCDPHIFYKRVRPYLTGWPKPGATYEGVSEVPRVYFGGSAAQSALIQAIDAFAGVNHDKATTGAYLNAIRQYIPPPHRQFIIDIERESRVRVEAEAGPKKLRAEYNRLIQKLDQFRCQHISLAHDYIAKPSGLDRSTHGTGGTEFANFLHASRMETAARRLTTNEQIS